MKNILSILLLFICGITLGQESNLRVNPSTAANKNKQWIPISDNGKHIFSTRNRKDGAYEWKGAYRGVLLTEFADSLASYFNSNNLLDAPDLSAYSLTSHTHTFASLTSKPTTFSGYAISDNSANLKTAITDETGSGALVFATSPTLVTPALGTPSSGNLSNCTGIPIVSDVAYNTTTWDNNTDAPTKNAVRDKFEEMTIAEISYTPTFTYQTNVSSAALLSYNAYQVGKTITIMGTVQVSFNSANTHSKFYMSLPYTPNVTPNLHGISTYYNEGFTPISSSGKIISESPVSSVVAAFYYMSSNSFFGYDRCEFQLSYKLP